MTLSRLCDSLAATSDAQFYATYGDRLYLLDPASMTEAVIGQTQNNANTALEFAGLALLDFTSTTDRLLQTDPITAATVGSPIDLGAQNRRSIILMRNADASALTRCD